MSIVTRMLSVSALALSAALAGACSARGGGFGGEGATGSTVTSGPSCAGLAPPATPASCRSCASSWSDCQANGCYGGWYCDTTTDRCQAPPTGCVDASAPEAGGSGSGGSGSSSGGSSGGSSGSSSGGSGGDAGAGVGPSGGTVSKLTFAVVGDTRPPNLDDTSGYPTAIATQIFEDLDGLSPRPAFGVSTGDYMYAQPGKGQAAPQLDLYVQARGNFSNLMFPAMGNHECTGYTASNCGAGTTDGTTENYDAFLSQLLGPLSKSDPYYAIEVDDVAGQWTSKFVFVAANAWTAAQATWLDATLARPTTYTFLVRHEPKSAGGSSGAPGVDPAEAIMAKYPYTLSIVGHSHLAEKSGAREVIFGNGGAPLTSGSYGFGLVTQLADGNVQIDDYDYQTVQPDPSFRFVLTPAGAPGQ